MLVKYSDKFFNAVDSNVLIQEKFKELRKERLK